MTFSRHIVMLAVLLAGISASFLAWAGKDPQLAVSKRPGREFQEMLRQNPYQRPFYRQALRGLGIKHWYQGLHVARAATVREVFNNHGRIGESVRRHYGPTALKMVQADREGAKHEWLDAIGRLAEGIGRLKDFNRLVEEQGKRPQGGSIPFDGRLYSSNDAHQIAEKRNGLEKEVSQARQERDSAKTKLDALEREEGKLSKYL